MAIDALVFSTMGPPSHQSHSGFTPKRLRRIALAGLFSLAALFCVHLSDPNETRRWLEGESVAAVDVQDEEENRSRRLGFGRDALRIAVFGGTQTWGLGVLDRYQAYPYLLSNSVDSYAHYSWGPNYPAVCAQTLVGNTKLYDLIVLEYWLWAEEGLKDLYDRLRLRYPNTLIVVVQMLIPRFAFRRETLPNGVVLQERFDEWKARTNPVLESAAIAADSAFWFFPNRPMIDTELAQVAQLANTQIVSFFPQGFQVNQLIADRWNFFDHGGHFLSADGHAHIAQQIQTQAQNFENQLQATINPAPDQLAMLQHSTLGSFGAGDSCHVWFTSGEVDFEYDAANIHLREFDGVNNERLAKYALEVDLAGGTINIENPLPTARQLYMSFLVDVPGVYPQTLVSWSGTTTPVSTLINPADANATEHHHKYLVRTLPIFYLSPGNTTVTLTPQETTQKKFRLAGISFSDDNVIPIVNDFAPQVNKIEA